ncbi:nucleotidyltransferase family protein [Hydrogenimonas sp.]
MSDKEEILAFLRNNKEMLRRRFHVVRIGLFGSFVKNRQRPDSDVDLIVEIEEGTPQLFTLKRELASFLEERFGRRVDLVREKYLKPYAKDAILKETIYV